MKNVFTKEKLKKSEIFRKAAAVASALAIVLGFTTNAVPTIGAADGSGSADGIAIDEANFPDAAFRQYVSDNCDTDTNGYLSDSEIAAVTSVSVEFGNISDMKGIEYFTALTMLQCYSNQLTELDVSQNTALETLLCFNNQLTELDVSQNAALTVLQCYSNQLTELDVSQNTALTVLYCDRNGLTELDVSQNTALTELICDINRLTELDVSQNTALTVLQCFKNQLTELDVSQKTALETLLCFDNQLTELDVSQNTALTVLQCYNNQLTALDVSQNAALKELNCHNNRLTALDVSQNTALNYFNCSDNKYTVCGSEVAIADLPGNFDPSKAADWTNAEVSDDKIISDGSCTATYTYDCGNNKTATFSIEFSETLIAIDEASFPDAAFRNYVSEEIDNDGSGYLSDSEIADVIFIYVPGEGISDMKGIEYFTALRALYCNNNQLTALDLSKNTALTELNCCNNQLTALDVSQNTALTWLDCYSNQLTELDVSQNTALTVLNCCNNQLTALDVSQNTALEMLYCFNNQLTALDVSQNAALTELYCDSNQLTELDVSQNTALIYLECTGNQLTELDVSQNTALEMLYCYDNQLTALDVSQNAALIALDCGYNQLTALDLSKNTALTELYCHNNRLTALDVSQNTALRYFGCNDNKYTVCGSEVAIADLPGSFDSSKASEWTNAEVKDGKIISGGSCTATYTYDCGNNNTETFSIEFSEKLIAIDEENFPDAVFRQYVSDNCDTDTNGYLTDSEIAAVTTVAVDSQNISDIKGIEYFTALKELYCAYNKLTELDVSRNTALAVLYCSGNQLTALDVSRNAALTEFDCADNQLTALDVSQSTALELLSCYSNYLTALNISKSTKLTYLDCSYNQLAALDVSQNTALATLNCYCNQLTALDVSQNTALTDKGCNLRDNKYNVCGSEVAIADLPGSFDSSKASGWTNAEVKDGKIISDGYCTATYTYDCGNNITATFSIEFVEHTGGTATCTQKAICDTCGKEYGELAAHTLTKTEAVPATCTAAGNEAYWTCSACGKMFSDESGTTEIESIPTIPAAGHEYGTDWRSDADNHWHECDCGDRADSAAHTEDSGTVTKAPTETETGERTYKCTVCGYVMRTETIDKLPPSHEHGYGTDWKSDADSHWHECTVCGDKSDRAAHTEDSGTVTKAPTETETGIRTYKCSVCGYEMRTETIDKLPSGGGDFVTPTEPTDPTEPSDPTDPTTPDEPITPSRPDNEVPFIKDENGKNGWEVINEEIGKAEDGGTITVDMNGATVVPGNVFDTLRGRDVTVVFDMGGGITWSVNGKDVTFGNTSDIDLSVKSDTENIPVDVINNITGERYSIQISLAHNGEFGFTAVLSINLGSGNAGRKASLYYYNGGALELMCESEISADGTARLKFTHASDYLIVIGESKTDEGDTSDTTSGESNPSEDDNSGTTSGTTSSGDTSEPGKKDPDEQNGNPSTGVATSLIPLAIAAAFIVAAAKRKIK